MLVCPYMLDLPEIKGKKIYLRQLKESDVTEEYVEWLNDPRVNRFLETRFNPQDRDTVLRFVVEKCLSDLDALFAICWQSDRKHIGNIKIGPRKVHHNSADVSLFIGACDYWGKGGATEAIYLASKFGFEVLGLNRLQAGCYASNTSSARAFEKAGYTKEAIFRSAISFEGRREDAFGFGILPHELRAPWV